MFQILMLLSYYYSTYIISNTLIIKSNYNNYYSNFRKTKYLMNTQNNKLINKFNNFNFDFKLILNHKTDVYIHIEKLYKRLPIYHIGVSFFDGYKTVRYDYRPFNENGSYITINKKDNDTFKNNIIYSKTLYWCQIEYPLKHIQKCEREIVNCYPKYKLGINDCRHYAYRLTLKTTNKATPIWKLSTLWNSIE